ncbi:MAG: type II secretion system F family protein [Parachlamydiales bacterium]|jgi:general secretion pathway protein F/type IV pilus assembly protein PilC
MPLYRYQTIDYQGKKRSGLIDSHSLQDAREKLREQGVMVSSLALDVSKGGTGALSGENLVTFTMQLAQMTGAGVPLYESLIALEEQTRKEKYNNVILSLCEQIKSGSSLSRAMGSFPNCFDNLYVGMISAGESAGALPLVLDRLAFFLGRQNKLKKEIGTALIYPGILSAFALVVIGLLLGFVIPSIEGLFENRPINGFTALVLGVSQFFRAWWWVIFPLIVLTITAIVLKLRSPSGKIWMQKFSLKLPFIHKLVKEASIARFCRTMGTLQQGGLTIIDSLRIARSVMGNVVLEEDMKRVEARIIEGSTFGAELGRSPWVPSLVARMIRVGEESGSIQLMFNKIADMYEDELEKNISRLMAMAQPLILITMGAIIGGVLMAVLLPLTDVSSLVG